MSLSPDPATPFGNPKLASTPLADRLYTADDVSLILEWFGGNLPRWIDHVKTDAREVVNVGQAPPDRNSMLATATQAVYVGNAGGSWLQRHPWSKPDPDHLRRASVTASHVVNALLEREKDV